METIRPICLQYLLSGPSHEKLVDVYHRGENWRGLLANWMWKGQEKEAPRVSVMLGGMQQLSTLLWSPTYLSSGMLSPTEDSDIRSVTFWSMQMAERNKTEMSLERWALVQRLWMMRPQGFHFYLILANVMGSSSLPSRRLYINKEERPGKSEKDGEFIYSSSILEAHIVPGTVLGATLMELAWW